MSESLLIPKLIETSTFNTLDYLKQQQLAIQKQLMEQEILNKNLYERLFNSGFLTTASTTLATSTSFLDSIRKKFNLNDNESSTSEPNVTKAQSGANILSALLPFGDMMSGISQIFTKLFGSEYWMYWFLAIFIGLLSMLLSCCCIYCMCCTRLGRSMCFCRCSGLSSSSQKKKEAKGSKKCCV